MTTCCSCSTQAKTRSSSRCRAPDGSCSSIPPRRAVAWLIPTICSRARSRCSSKPGREPHLVGMGEQVVPGIHADAVVQAPGEAGLQIQPIALLALFVGAGGRELVAVR